MSGSGEACTLVNVHLSFLITVHSYYTNANINKSWMQAYFSSLACFNLYHCSLRVWISKKKKLHLISKHFASLCSCFNWRFSKDGDVNLGLCFHSLGCSCHGWSLDFCSTLTRAAAASSAEKGGTNWVKQASQANRLVLSTKIMHTTTKTLILPSLLAFLPYVPPFLPPFLS